MSWVPWFGSRGVPRTSSGRPLSESGPVPGRYRRVRGHRTRSLYVFHVVGLKRFETLVAVLFLCSLVVLM